MTEPDQAAPAGAEAQPMYVLEPPVPLAQSMVWKLQSTFYADQGIDAWGRSHVPQSVTTSPIIASAYASIVLGYWRDVQASLDPSQPLYLVELGAGSGRFAFRFLKAFNTLLRDLDSGEPRPRIVHVMTDAALSVLEFWRTNAFLRPLVEAGMLDFAHFDLRNPAPLTLLNSGAVLDVGRVRNPLVLFANYIFDSIPQDAFTIRDGKLYSGLISMSASSPELNLTHPDTSVRVSISYSTDDVPVDVEAEPDPLLRELVHGYLERMPETTVLIPRQATSCVRFFQELSGRRGLCLVADLGDTNEDEIRGHGPPAFGVGGAFWLAVNFHALGEYVRRMGGSARHPRQRNINLNISMLKFGESDVPLTSTELAYTTAIDQRGPDDLAVMLRAMTGATALGSLTIEMLLALLRTSGWDSDYVRGCVPVLIELIPDAERRYREELLKGVDLTWEQYYPIGDSDDLPFALGVLLYSLEQYPRALELFQRSLHDYGEDPRTTLNLALTMYRMNRLAESVDWLDRTLALDPTNELANAMRPSVVAEMAEAAGYKTVKRTAGGASQNCC